MQSSLYGNKPFLQGVFASFHEVANYSQNPYYLGNRTNSYLWQRGYRYGLKMRKPPRVATQHICYNQSFERGLALRDPYIFWN